jgi:RHS repeat-associated protein
MFQFSSEQLASIRRKKIGDALIATFANSPVRACWNAEKSTVVATDPLDNCTRFDFDRQGFIGSVASPAGRIWQIENMADGKPAVLKNPAGHTFGMTYSPAGQLDSISSNGRARLRVLYNERQMQTGASFPDGTHSAIDLTPWNAPALTTDRLGVRESFEYDNHRRLIAFADGKGARTQFRYGRWSRPDAAIDPNGAVESYAYNNKGFVRQIATETSRVDLDCNEKGRPIRMQFSDGAEAHYQYDSDGRATEGAIGDHLCKAVWNDEGRLVEEHNGDAVILYEYDKAGRLTGMTYPSGEKIEYQWDADSRLIQVLDWNGGKHAVHYAEHDRGFTVRGPNGVDTHTRLTDLGSAESIVIAQHSNAIFSLGYAYDEENRVSVLRDSAFGDRSFSYDAEGQLLTTSSQNDRLKESFQYDAAGNPILLSGKPARFDSANQMLSHGHSRFAYDGRGNLVSMDSAEGVWRFTYNARNYMVRSESPAGEGTTYDYDAYGRRIRKTRADSVVEFIWAGEQLIGEVIKTGESVVRRDYLYFPGTFTPLAMRIAGKVYSYHTDHLGTPRVLTAPDGSIAWAAGYSSFGETRVLRATVDNPLRAPGQYFDAESGLHYNRFRYYSPVMGRYLSRDPLGLLADSNFYSYAGNNPINSADPLGLWTWLGVAETVGTVAAAAAVAVAVVALAPIALPVAIVLAGAAAGAVAGGLNQAFNEKNFCLPCILKAAGLGALAGAVASLPFLALPATAGIAAFAAAGAASGGLNYATNVIDGANSNPSWTGFGESIAFGAATAGAARFVVGAVSALRTPDEVPEGFDEVYSKAPAAKAEIDGMADDIASDYDGDVAEAPIKSQERALEKIMNDYEGDPTQIKDLARNTIIVQSDQIDSVANELASRGATVKVIDGATNELGYSGVNATVNTDAGIPAEIQVNSPEMVYAKEPESIARQQLGDDVYDQIAAKTGIPGGQGHALYEQYRVLDPDSPEAQTIADQSKSYYNSIRGGQSGE